MKKYSILFFIKQSFQGLFMNSVMSITSIFFLTLCLIVTGCSILLVLNTDLNLQQLDNLNKIMFFIEKDYPADKEMDEVKKLAYGDMDPFYFMEKFHGMECSTLNGLW